MTTAHVVILGFLCERPMHGYEIKQVIGEHMEDWTDIKFGSIYFALSKLQEKGFVEVQEETREGGRPSRTVYRITDRGRAEFRRLLSTLWAGNEKVLYPFDIALFFIGGMPKEDARRYLEKRMEYARKALEHLDAHLQSMEEDEVTLKRAAAIIGHTRVHMEAELRFLEGVAAKLEEYY
jgi:DNA-binding PadR family transcriptional regulator